MPEGGTARHGNIRGETKSGVKWALAAPSPKCILAPPHSLSKRPGCYHSTSRTRVRDRIFKLNPIHGSVIY